MAARRAEESRAVDDVGLALENRLQQERVFARVVFEIGVLDDDEVARSIHECRARRRRLCPDSWLAGTRGCRLGRPTRRGCPACHRASRRPRSRVLFRCRGDRPRGRERRSREWWPARCSRASRLRQPHGLDFTGLDSAHWPESATDIPACIVASNGQLDSPRSSGEARGSRASQKNGPDAAGTCDAGPSE